MNRTKNRAAVMFFVVAVIIFIILGVLIAVPPTRRSLSYPSILVMSGVIEPRAADTYPRVYLKAVLGDAPLQLAVTCTSSLLRMPPPLHTATLPTGTHSMQTVCDGLQTVAVRPGSPFVFSPADMVLDKNVSHETVLGLARARAADGQYVSPFLRDLVRRHYGGSWCMSERLKTVTLYAGVVNAPCFTWVWTPLLPGELYAIALQPGSAAPWTTAVLDVGRWVSILPGAAPQEVIQLQTSTWNPLLVTVFDTTAVPGSNSSTCILGLSALAWNSICCFDVSNSRFGLVNAQVGNVVTNAGTYSF